MNQECDEFKRTVQEFSNWLDSIPPYEFSLSATIIAYIIAPFLGVGAQNALGNWFEQLGQIILTISAQASATPTTNEYQALLNQVERLENELKDLKKRI